MHKFKRMTKLQCAWKQGDSASFFYCYKQCRTITIRLPPTKFWDYQFESVVQAMRLQRQSKFEEEEYQVEHLFNFRFLRAGDFFKKCFLNPHCWTPLLQCQQKHFISPYNSLMWSNYIPSTFSLNIYKNISNERYHTHLFKKYIDHPQCRCRNNSMLSWASPRLPKKSAWPCFLSFRRSNNLKTQMEFMKLTRSKATFFL